MTEKTENVLSKRHLHAIGLLFVRLSMLESVIMDLIARLTDMNAIEVIITVGHQQFSSKIDTIKTLCNMKLAKYEGLKRLLDLLAEAKEISDFRNMIAHASWAFDDDGTPLAVRFYARGQFERKRKPLPPEEIETRADDALRVRKELRDFVKMLDRQLADAPSPDKSHP